MARSLRILIICLIAVPVAGTKAQHGPDRSRRITQYPIDHWSTGQGLPQSSVMAMAQGRNGYLWLGTQEGLVRFDGVRFTLFDSAPGGAGQSVITSLAEDAAGALWVGTMGEGLYRLERGAFELFGKPLPNSRISTLLHDRRGRLWIGFFGPHLSVLTDRGIQAVRLGTTNEEQEVTSLCEDAGGLVWAGLRVGGVARIEENLSVTFLPVLAHTTVSVMAAGADGRLWVGTRNHGVFELSGGRLLRRYTTADGLPSDDVLSLAVGEGGELWIGLNHGGLSRLQAGRLETLTTEQGLAHNKILALLRDREGSLWVGTDGGGLNRLSVPKVVTYTRREGLPSDQINTVFEDREGAIWAGTDGGGAARISRDGVWAAPAGRRQEKGVVYAFAQTPDGSLWIGWYGGGLSRIQGGRTTVYTEKDGLPDDEIYGLFTDSGGGLWISTGKGLALFADERFQRYGEAQGLGSSQITAIEEDRNGNILVGTFDQGLFVLRGGRVVRRIDRAGGLRCGAILCLYADAVGDLWVGAGEGGLQRIRGDRITSFTTAHGLPSDKVFSILEDGHGRLWMTSNRGLFSLLRSDLNALADGQRLHPTVFDAHDGLISQEFTGGVQPAAWKGADGRLWFPSTHGVVSVDPDNIPFNRIPPPVVLEQFIVDGEVQPIQDGVTLPAGSKSLEFVYTGISLAASDRVQFRYRLDGVDADWVDSGTRRAAYYTNVPPGSYTFRVMARNADGIWSTSEALLSFSHEPFFYQTIWFYLLAALSFFGLFYAFYRWRVLRLHYRQVELQNEVEARTLDLRLENERATAARREAEEAHETIARQADRLRELDHAKTTFFNNISHEFRTPLTLNIGPLENALTGFYGPLSDDLRVQLSIVLRNARRLLRLINQLLDISKLENGKMLLRPRRGDIASFLEGITYSFTAFAERKNLRIDFSSESAAMPLSFDPECVEKIMYNLISNAVKFTPEHGRISVSVFSAEISPRTGRAVEIWVEDTGPGIPEHELPLVFDRFHQVDGVVSNVQEGTGLGLALVKELIDLHRGTIHVESTDGIGTAFRVTLPEMVGEEMVGMIGGDGCRMEAPLMSRGPMVEMAVFEDEDLPEANTGAYGADRPVVLVVDDSRDIRDYIAGCLRDTFTIRFASDGQEALESLEISRPDLVISDVMMPRMDGAELCRIIKSDPRHAALPVILLTARNGLDERVEGLEAGADDYLVKPFHTRELVARSRNLVALRSQQKALESANKELQRTNRALEDAAEVKSQLLHIAAHDLKTPLSGIRGIAQVLKEELTVPQAEELLNLIISGADRMSGMIDQVLEAEVLEGGNIEMDVQILDLSELTRSAVDEFRHIAEAKQQAIDLELVAGGQALVSASAEWLKEALLNLLSNAVKYAPFGSAILVRTTRDEQRVRVHVRDQGPGIPVEEQPLLFRKFQRLSPQPTGGESSTGLGLSIVKQIVEHHDGTVRVDSRPGMGSEFVIELPPLPAPEPEPVH